MARRARSSFSAAKFRRQLQADLQQKFPETRFDERLYGRTRTDAPDPYDPRKPHLDCIVRADWSPLDAYTDAVNRISRELSPFLVSRSRPLVRLHIPHYHGGQISVAAWLQIDPLPVPEWSERELLDAYVNRTRWPLNDSEATLLVMAAETSLAEHVEKFNPYGWMLLECHMLDSSYLGQRTMLPFGPDNTYKAIPTHPVSPRGLASDMSVVLGVHLRYPHHVVHQHTVKEPKHGQVEETRE